MLVLGSYLMGGCLFIWPDLKQWSVLGLPTVDIVFIMLESFK